jgi:MoxR-like ATPase
VALASALHELSTLISSHHPLVVIETTEEQRARRLVSAAAQSLGLSFYEWSITQGLRFGSDRDVGGHGIATTQEPGGVLGHIAALDRTAVFLLKDLGPHLEDPVNARRLREVCQAFVETRSTVVLTGRTIDLPEAVEPHAVWLELALPDEDELRGVLRATLDSLAGSPGLEVRLEEDDREALVSALRGLTLNQARQAIAYAALEDGRLSRADLERVVDRKARLIRDGGLLEYRAPEENDFELGGFARLEEWLDRAEQGFTAEAEALRLGPPRGLLLVGVQGCGKSLAAKAIARRWRQPLLKLDAGRLYDKYVGESDRNLRRALALAESMAPAVLWIDEIEKAFSITGDADVDGGLSRRLQGHLLTWLQEKRSRVFVVATANDVFALPPELMRKGRFDEIFFVDLPRPDERRSIFEIHLRRRGQDPATLLVDDLVLASEGMSGAEIEQAVVAGLYRALHEKRPLESRHLLAELDATVPLSRSRAEDIERLRALARDRFVPVA